MPVILFSLLLMLGAAGPAGVHGLRRVRLVGAAERLLGAGLAQHRGGIESRSVAGGAQARGERGEAQQPEHQQKACQTNPSTATNSHDFTMRAPLACW